MKALVTGGGGFLGGGIARLLRERGDQVRSFSRGRYDLLESLTVEQISGDIADVNAVAAAAQGCDVVFHVAAKAGIAGRYEDFYRANVLGTENVIAACQKHGIQRLVYTSSPSVVFTGTDMEGVDESVPYPLEHDAHYPATKALGERAVLMANRPGLATVALRPHLIWGPRDNHLVPRILARGRSGRLRRVGSSNKLIDSIYIDNAADAHLLAADRLHPASAIAGRAYFLSNGEPLPTWNLINRILATGGVPPVTRSVPAWLAVVAGRFLETLYAGLWPDAEPPMTAFLAHELSTAHWFDISAAKRDLGYNPKVSIDEGLHRLETWLKSSESAKSA
jgi:nucleoside-diphosphate-sugar epimerase